MKDGFVKVAAVTTKIKVADCDYNTDRIIEAINKCVAKGVDLVTFPELCITGYTCGDMFFQDMLLDSAISNLCRIVEESVDKSIVIVVGMPYAVKNNLYNMAFAICNGKILGAVPKSFIPNYAHFYEKRYFESGENVCFDIMDISDDKINKYGYFTISAKQIFRHEFVRDFTFAIEICEDLWAVNPPSNNHALAGANIIVNLSASDEVVGKKAYRQELVRSQSARLIAGYVYASAGYGESTTDLVFSGHNIIAENGIILEQSGLFDENITISEIDCKKLASERRKNTSFTKLTNEDYIDIIFAGVDNKVKETSLTRKISKTPFIPMDKKTKDERCRDVLEIQTMGLVKRLDHIGCRSVVLGISGGLDSTLALIVTVKAFDKLGLDRKNIIAVTMPCFGTTDRTYNNAISLVKHLGATIKEISIEKAVKQHFDDIGHDINDRNITYENSQARERTQVIMDIANMSGGIVIGTGDMSELALGWATYNGDHMSMYGVNASVPKTLVRYLVNYYASNVDNKELQEVLYDVLDTPVSPELLPADNDGKIAQKTEDIVGPYELHDFFLYNIVRNEYDPKKVYRLAVYAFEGDYSEEVILKWLKVFYRRFFSQQFKRSCIPDGPKVGSVDLSPRGGFRMPSDACVNIWLNELAKLG